VQYSNRSVVLNLFQFIPHINLLFLYFPPFVELVKKLKIFDKIFQLILFTKVFAM